MHGVMNMTHMTAEEASSLVIVCRCTLVQDGSVGPAKCYDLQSDLRP